MQTVCYKLITQLTPGGAIGMGAHKRGLPYYETLEETKVEVRRIFSKQLIADLFKDEP